MLVMNKKFAAKNVTVNSKKAWSRIKLSRKDFSRKMVP